MSEFDQNQRAKSVFSQTPISQSFTLVEQIGEGTFSMVYLAQDKDSPHRKLALKHLVATSKPSRILMEAHCIKAAGDHHNVIKLLGMWRVGGDVILAMPYVEHCKFIDLVATITLDEARFYIANLLSALAHIHKLGIIHRDIKPGNFLYDRQRRKFALVDFGLAQCERDLLTSYRPDKRELEDQSESSSKKPWPPITEADSKSSSALLAQTVAVNPLLGLQVSCSCLGQMTVCNDCLSLPILHATKSGTPGFKPLEVLLKSPNQSMAVDIWAVGVIQLSLLSGSYPFFRSPEPQTILDDVTALAELISLFGSKAVQAAAKK